MPSMKRADEELRLNPLPRVDKIDVTLEQVEDSSSDSENLGPAT